MTIGQSESRAGNPEKVAEKGVQGYYPLVPGRVGCRGKGGVMQNETRRGRAGFADRGGESATKSPQPFGLGAVVT